MEASSVFNSNLNEKQCNLTELFPQVSFSEQKEIELNPKLQSRPSDVDRPTDASWPRPPAVLQPHFREVCAQVCVTVFLDQKSLTIQTTDEVVRVHAEQAVSCQPLGVGTADVEGLQAAVAEPPRQPLQLAVTEQAAGVQNAADTRQKSKFRVSHSHTWFHATTLGVYVQKWPRFTVFFYVYRYFL